MIAGPDDPNGSAGPHPAGTKSGTLSYVTDIIEELKRLADTAIARWARS